MEVVVDPNVCQGYGNCAMIAPDIFELDEESGVSSVRVQPRDDQRPVVDEAVRSCPVGAITLLDEQ